MHRRIRGYDSHPRVYVADLSGGQGGSLSQDVPPLMPLLNAVELDGMVVAIWVPGSNSASALKCTEIRRRPMALLLALLLMYRW